MGRRGRRGPKGGGLRVLLLGRTRPRRAGGGIARSAHLIVRTLRSVGDSVELRGAHLPAEPVTSGTHVVVHYADLEGLGAHMREAAAAGVPMLVNSSYDGTERRCQWMCSALRKWSEIHPAVMFFCFSEAARNDYRLITIRDRLVVLPKTVRRMTGKLSTFAERQGICLGEIEKARKARLVAGLGAGQAVRALRRVLPDVPLVFYDQYAPVGRKVSPEGTKLAPYMGDQFPSWLGSFRLFISLSRHETFGMVPAEAQSAGTVVLYRHQPQSLDEHLAQTAFGFDSADELALGARLLYGIEPLWSQYSRAGIANARAKCAATVGAQLDLALRKAILRHKMLTGKSS